MHQILHQLANPPTKNLYFFPSENINFFDIYFYFSSSSQILKPIFTVYTLIEKPTFQNIKHLGWQYKFGVF